MNNYQQTADSALKQFRATAVIDWLDVEIHTERPTQHQHIRKALKEITGVNRWWVEPIDIQPGDVTDTFRIRFHDKLANNYQQLRAALHALARRFTFAAEPTIAGIEVSCDFWHRQNSLKQHTLSHTDCKQACSHRAPIIANTMATTEVTNFLISPAIV